MVTSIMEALRTDCCFPEKNPHTRFIVDIIQLFCYNPHMPITKRAIKKLRHDRIRTKQTDAVQVTMRKLIKSARTKPTQKSMSTVFKALDKATKQHVIHKNKAARLKSRLSKLLAKK